MQPYNSFYHIFFCKIFKCYERHTVAGKPSTCHASSTAPFCGNAASSVSSDNSVDPGVCGKCQRAATGGGVALICNKHDQRDCATSSSCGTNKYCCDTGKCVAANKNALDYC